MWYRYRVSPTRFHRPRAVRFSSNQQAQYHAINAMKLEDDDCQASHVKGVCSSKFRTVFRRVDLKAYRLLKDVSIARVLDPFPRAAAPTRKLASPDLKFFTCSTPRERRHCNISFPHLTQHLEPSSLVKKNCALVSILRSIMLSFAFRQ